MIRVARVRRGSIAEDVGIQAGTLLLRLNGRELRDSLDLLFLQADDTVELAAEAPDGSPLVYEIDKNPDDSLGIVPEPDKIIRCTNACSFCFVKGNPKARKLRPSLYIKDDDYRLSFMHGHYITLTNLREEDWERILVQRLSPLYISVHSTDPAVRLTMLKNPKSARISEQLDRLQAGGIRYHTQVVLCPSLNDGPVLQRTIDDLYARGEAVLSLSVVPVGLTKHNMSGGIRELSPEECRTALDQIDTVRTRAIGERGRGWCYAGDELFLQMGLEPPGAEYYDDEELVGNGVGAISVLQERVHRDLPHLPRLDGKRILLVTGTSLGPTLSRLGREIARRCGAEFVTVASPNSLYGPSVTTAGLLPGRDHLEAIACRGASFDLALFSRLALNAEDRFLDDMPLQELREALPSVEICPSEHITDIFVRA